MTVAEKTGSNHSWQPLLGARADRLRLLGELLRLRRAAIGYRHVPAFVRDRDINTRMAGDIEHGRRDTYTFPTLEDIATAYKVTYKSMMAVVWSDAGELVPAEEAPAAPPVPAREVPPRSDGASPFGPARTDSDRPWFDEINERRVALAARGVTDPGGEQMFPADPEAARAWDSIAAYGVPAGDRVWALADLRRRAADRAGNSGTGAAGA
jgi:hypothetical protein